MGWVTGAGARTGGSRCARVSSPLLCGWGHCPFAVVIAAIRTAAHYKSLHIRPGFSCVLQVLRPVVVMKCFAVVLFIVQRLSNVPKLYCSLPWPYRLHCDMFARCPTESSHCSMYHKHPPRVRQASMSSARYMCDRNMFCSYRPRKCR